MKTCLACHNELVGGRKDRKFCDAQCRASYHNKARQKEEEVVQNINNILRRNWKILKRLHPQGHTVIDKVLLERQGYQFNYFTHQFENQEGVTYYFCYDLGIYEQNHQITVVEWQPYMRFYKLPIAKL